jgi:hypothetical protein
MQREAPFYGGDVVVGGDANLVFYGGIGGGIDLGSRRNDVVVAVENQWFLSHLQHLVDVKVREILTPAPSPLRGRGEQRQVP